MLTEKEVEDMSLPSRERGLKFNKAFDVLGEGVAPFAGAWIEIGKMLQRTR